MFHPWVLSEGILLRSTPIAVGMREADWRKDPKPIRDYVELATADGCRPSSIDQGRSILLRYRRFLRDRFTTDLNRAGWQEFAAYKNRLLKTAVSRATIRGYLQYVGGYYLLKSQATQDSRLLEHYLKMRVIGMTRRSRSEEWKPFSSETLQRIVAAAKSYSKGQRGSRAEGSEDYAFVMTLLYTGGRAQFYGLRTDEIDFDRQEISVLIKGGRRKVIPLHPRLARMLKHHLATRDYVSEFIFRRGRDPSSRTGQKANRQNAWRVCKRVQKAADLSESVHPHRFRKTLAAMGKRLGMDLQFVQTILGHVNARMTLERYATADLEDVKREFARIDLRGNRGTSGERSPPELISSLRRLAPHGKQQAWNMVVDGLLALLDDGGRPQGQETARRIGVLYGHADRGKLRRPASLVDARAREGRRGRETVD